MPVPLEPGDRKLLIVAGLLLASMAAAGLLLGPGSARSQGYPSSYSAAPDGAKAAYLLLGELGYSVERWERPPRDLPRVPGNAALILADPLMAASTEEKREIQNFIAQGGRVLATGMNGVELLPEAGLQPGGRLAFEAERFPAVTVGPLSRKAPEIALRAPVRWGARSASHLPYYADKDGATVVKYGRGKGQAIWWAGSEPLTNSGLAEASNVMLLLNSIGPPGQTRVLWDEYFHGQRPGLGAYLARTPAPWLLAQFVILAAALLLTHSRRSSPARPAASGGSRLSPLEFIETLGDLYHRKGAAPEALEVAYHRFRFLLLRRLGLPASATLQQLSGGVRERLGWHDTEFFRVLQRCEHAIEDAELREAEALRLIAALHDYTRRGRFEGGFRGDFRGD